MTRYCIKCGKEISENAAFCKYCGAKQEEIKRKEHSKSNNINTKNTGRALVVIVLIIFLLGGLYIHWSSMAQSDMKTGYYQAVRIIASEEDVADDSIELPFSDGRRIILSDMQQRGLQSNLTFYLDENGTFYFSPTPLNVTAREGDDLITGNYQYDKESKVISFTTSDGYTIKASADNSQYFTINMNGTVYGFKGVGEDLIISIG